MSSFSGELSCRAVAKIVPTWLVGRDASLFARARPRPRDVPVMRNEAITPVVYL